MPRGKIPFPRWAEIGQLDTEAMGTVGRYHKGWRETIKVDTDGDGRGEAQREERMYTIRCQVEFDRTELQKMTRSGDVPSSAVGVIPHMKWMEANGLVNLDGSLVITPNARLYRILNGKGDPIETYGESKLYCQEVTPLDSIGKHNNLRLLMFGERPSGRS